MTSTLSPTTQHLRLGAFEGSWQGEEEVFASAWTVAGTAQAEIESEVLFGGFFVEQSYRQQREGKLSFAARNMLAFDAIDGAYKLYQFDSVGFVPQAPATGQWEGDSLLLVKTSPRGRQRTLYTFENEDRYRMSVQFAPAGSDEWQDVISGVYRRVVSVSSNQTQEGL
jgi:hypothetical protein